VHIDSPADRAGIQEGDRILQIDGFRVHSYHDLRNYHRNMRQGDSVEIKIERGREILGIEVKYPVIPFAPVRERPEDEQKSIKQDN
jgi:S1-C subfamily serine protease